MGAVEALFGLLQKRVDRYPAGGKHPVADLLQVEEHGIAVVEPRGKLRQAEQLGPYGIEAACPQNFAAAPVFAANADHGRRQAYRPLAERQLVTQAVPGGAGGTPLP